MPFQKILIPQKEYDLIRIGKDNDGGYLVDKESFLKTEEIVSLGINDDWSFEEESLKLIKNVKINCFDDKLDEKFLLKKILNQAILVFYNKNFKLLKNYIFNFFSFKKLKKKIYFVKKSIFYSDLDNILKKCDTNNIFLKIDIEGGEYRILNEILKNQNRIIGMVIEFHDFDLHKKKIYDFIESLNLEIVHIHGNNFAKCDPDGDITVLEVTFGRTPIALSNKNVLPNKLDMSNDANKEEIKLNFLKS